MSTLHFLLPGDPATRTGGYLYDSRMMRELADLGWHVAHHRLADRFPFPDRQALDQAAALLAGLPDGALALIDGLALGAMPGAVAAQAGRLRIVGLVHHPLAEETGLDDAQRRSLFDSERAALAPLRRIIVTSPFTAQALAAYGVPADRVTTIMPGTDPADPARGSGGPALGLLTVGSLTPRKGHDVLLTALARLRHRDWRLTLAGGARDPATARRVKEFIENNDLPDRVSLVGEIDEAALARLYDSADLFVLASHYEGYGMVFAEALARGLPVIGTTGGAIPTTVPREAGLLVPPGDAPALADALARVLDDPALLARLRAGALAARNSLPDWRGSALRLARVLEEA
ncbi:glycosyltransferase family 4 protein [Oceanibaculum pacificum]|uniref:Glycosyl transferase, group 1 n=1 Tax=Oceanibaculum pacificum TaxID=580166 RepID=A0A154WG85_9PROT|nr:glycosyltransferase family 4 protein [Oceanibaculum pacificum]KZD12522.1 glycosyl transferase, group 1 [Oceanibaculum pacificum]